MLVECFTATKACYECDDLGSIQSPDDLLIGFIRFFLACNQQESQERFVDFVIFCYKKKHGQQPVVLERGSQRGARDT
jgi:hypothetical protein